MIDGFLLNLINKAIDLIPTDGLNSFSILISIVSANIPYFYSIFFLGRFGQSIGKFVTQVKVVDYATENKIGYYQAFIRDFIPIALVNTIMIVIFIMFYGEDLQNFHLSTIGTIFLLIPTLMVLIWSIAEIVTMFGSDKNRALHDKIGNTVVIRTNFLEQKI